MPVFADQTREQMRRAYLEAWAKFTARTPLEPLEAQLATVITDHPEYIPLIESGEEALTADFAPESGRVNPFLHMAMHIAIREQIATDRPPGIARIYRKLTQRLRDIHEVEHMMLGPLAELMWKAQHSGRTPDEQEYLERLRAL